jgi:hypothetical protein
MRILNLKNEKNSLSLNLNVEGDISPMPYRWLGCLLLKLLLYYFKKYCL